MKSNEKKAKLPRKKKHIEKVKKKIRQELSKRWQSQLKDVKITTIEFRSTYICDTLTHTYTRLFILPYDGIISIMCPKLWDEIQPISFWFTQTHTEQAEKSSDGNTKNKWWIFLVSIFDAVAENDDVSDETRRIYVCSEVGWKFYVLHL